MTNSLTHGDANLQSTDLLKCEEESAGDHDEYHGEIKDTSLLCHHYPSIAVELVPSREHSPLSCVDPLPMWRLHWRGVSRADLTVLTFPNGLINSEMHLSTTVETPTVRNSRAISGDHTKRRDRPVLTLVGNIDESLK